MDIDDFTADVTRVVVVNHSGKEEHVAGGRVIDMSDITVELQLQDDGQTLKVFIQEGIQYNELN